MNAVDVPQLKRLRAAISATLSSTPERTTRGLPAAYTALRAQVIEALPGRLANEAAAIAPELPESATSTAGSIDNQLLATAQWGPVAQAHLSSLEGWLAEITRED